MDLPNVLSYKNQQLHDRLISNEDKQSYKLTENHLLFLSFKWKKCYCISWQLEGILMR